MNAAKIQPTAHSEVSSELVLSKETNGVFWPVLRTLTEPGQRFMLAYTGQIDQLYVTPPALGCSTPQRDCPEQDSKTCTGGIPGRTSRHGSEAITVLFTTGQVNECEDGKDIAGVIAPSAKGCNDSAAAQAASPALNDKPDQKPLIAGAESAQIAIESIAITHDEMRDCLAWSLYYAQPAAERNLDEYPRFQKHASKCLSTGILPAGITLIHNGPAANLFYENLWNAPTQYSSAKQALDEARKIFGEKNELLPSTPPLPGQFWPEQQGYYVGILPAQGSESAYHLILAAHDLPAADGGLGHEWGSYGEEIAGASSLSDGHSNTQAMLTADLPLAKHLAELMTGWHIPSSHEMSLIRATCSEHMSKELYWTSSQISAGDAWFQSFSLGLSYWYCKTSSLRVRPVRRLFL